jgi:transposase-like protein
MLSLVKNMIKIMVVTGVGIQDIGIILGISITTVLKVLKSTRYTKKPKQTHYDCLEIGGYACGEEFRQTFYLSP